MKNIRFFFSENFPFLVVKLSIYLNRCVFIMSTRPFLAHLYEGEGRAIAVSTSSVLVKAISPEPVDDIDVCYWSEVL